MGAKNLTGRSRRKKRIRKKIYGATERPRLTVFRSLRHIYAQIIDDTKGLTLVSASTKEKGLNSAGANKANAAEVGKRLAERATAAKIETVVFDRNGYLYHGCVKALADGAREKGLRF
jgi:large subunit ribosomal protein L18